MYLHIEALSCSPHPTFMEDRSSMKQGKPLFSNSFSYIGGWREKIVLEILEIMGLSINSCREKQQVTEWKVS